MGLWVCGPGCWVVCWAALLLCCVAALNVGGRPHLGLPGGPSSFRVSPRLAPYGEGGSGQAGEETTVVKVRRSPAWVSLR